MRICAWFVVVAACDVPPPAPPGPPSARTSAPFVAGDEITAFEGYLPRLDPLRDTGVADRRWQDLVFDRLYHLAADGSPRSRVVERDAVADGQLVVTLAPGIAFHDGSALDAADVCATLGYLAAVGRPAPACEVLGERVVRLGTTDRAALDLALLPSGLTPEQLAEDAPFWEEPVGTGPMRGRAGRRETLLRRHPGAHRAVGVGTVHVAQGGSPAIALRVLESGAAHLAFDVDPAGGPAGVVATRLPGGGVVAARPDVAIPTALPVDRLFVDSEGLRRW